MNHLKDFLQHVIYIIMIIINVGLDLDDVVVKFLLPLHTTVVVPIDVVIIIEHSFCYYGYCNIIFVVNTNNVT